MDRDSIDWKGYWAAVPTPFVDDDKVDFESLGQLTSWYIEEGLHGLFVNGTTGEWFSQTFSERLAVAETVLGAVESHVNVVIGVTALTAKESIEIGNHAMENGAVGIALSVPPYVKPLENETVAFYEKISRSVEAPIMMYNWPHGTSIDIGTELADRLSDIEGVVALKDSTPSADQFFATAERILDRVRVFGNFMSLRGLSFLKETGGDGMIGGGSLFGRADAQYWEDVWVGDWAAAEKHAVATESLFNSLWAPGGWRGLHGGYQSELKAAMKMLSIPGGGAVRSPRLPITDEDDLSAIRLALVQAGLLKN